MYPLLPLRIPIDPYQPLFTFVVPNVLIIVEKHIGRHNVARVNKVCVPTFTSAYPYLPLLTPIYLCSAKRAHHRRKAHR
jgi:hypothetical protein